MCTAHTYLGSAPSVIFLPCFAFLSPPFCNIFFSALSALFSLFDLVLSSFHRFRARAPKLYSRSRLEYSHVLMFSPIPSSRNVLRSWTSRTCFRQTLILRAKSYRARAHTASSLLIPDRLTFVGCLRIVARAQVASFSCTHFPKES